MKLMSFEHHHRLEKYPIIYLILRVILAQIKLPQRNKFNQTLFLTQISVFLVTRRRRQSEYARNIPTW